MAKLFEHFKLSRLLWLTAIDLVSFGFLNFFFWLNGDAGLFLLIWTFLTSLLIYAVLTFLKNKDAIYFLINSILGPAILFATVSCSVYIYYRSSFEEKVFYFQKKKYELNINKKARTYSIGEVKTEDYSWMYYVIHGKIVKNHDNTISFGSKQNYRKRNDTLFDFPETGNKLMLMDKDL